MSQATLEKFRLAGVGLLSVGDTAYELLAPTKGRGASERVYHNLWRRVRAQYNTDRADTADMQEKRGGV